MGGAGAAGSGFVVCGEEDLRGAAPGPEAEGDLKPAALGIYFHSFCESIFHLTQHRCE